jgi:hypothetical protein
MVELDVDLLVEARGGVEADRYALVGAAGRLAAGVRDVRVQAGNDAASASS